MKTLVAAALAVLFACNLASAWTVEEMNKTIDSANFIVDDNCSGTLISLEHRLILTNHHCIGSGIKRVTREVVAPDGTISKRQIEELRDLKVSQRGYAEYRQVSEKTYMSVIVARWKESDLALLQIRDTTLPNAIAAKVYSGDSVLRGEPVIAVGNPLGLDATVTMGVVSSTNRMFRVSWADNEEVPFIQIDAGIAGGNSGGSMFNDAGELIGVPAAGARNQGHLGLAIPFFRVQEFLTEHCYGDVWDAEAASHEDCVASKDEEGGKVSSSPASNTEEEASTDGPMHGNGPLIIKHLRKPQGAKVAPQASKGDPA